MRQGRRLWALRCQLCAEEAAEPAIDASRLAAEKAQFEELGFCVVKQALDERQMARIEQELAQFIAETMPGQPGPWDGKSYTCEVPGDHSTVWRISPLNTPFLDHLGATLLTTIWETMFGAKVAGPPASQFFDKTPGGSNYTPAHQDGGFSMREYSNGLLHAETVF